MFTPTFAFAIVAPIVVAVVALLLSTHLLVPSKRHYNWAPVTWTPAGGSLTTLTGVQDVRINMNVEIAKHAGDADQGPTTVIASYMDPQLQVDFRDLSLLHTMAPGSRGLLLATHQDAKNRAAATGGAYIVSLANAVVGDTPSGGRYRDFGQGSLMLHSEWPDGVTSPLTYAAA